MKECIYPGSFDPVTLGHLNIMERASRLFDRVIVGVLNNPRKKNLFSADQRVELIKQATKSIPNLEVCKFNGLLADFARQRNCSVILKGIRSVEDFEYEKDMALCNQKLYPALETVILNTHPKYSCVSSSAVRDILYFKGDLTGFVPDEVKENIQQIYKMNMGE